MDVISWHFRFGRILKLLLAARQNIGKFEYVISFRLLKFHLPCHFSNTYCMDSTFKVYFMLFLLTRDYNFIEETWQFEIHYFSVAVREVLIFGPRVISICHLCYVLASLGDFLCWAHNIFLARVEAPTITKNSSWFIHFVLNKYWTKNVVSLWLRLAARA